LGFAIAEPVFAARIAAALGPWPVSGPAAWIAARAFADAEWIAATRQRLAAAAARLDALLRAGGLEIIGGTSLYRLATSRHARAIDAALRAHGIYARSFPERPDWLRFGLLPDDAAESRLASTLASVAENSSSLIDTEVSR
jgi:cobalamin biosynthetic protein CobC